MKPRHETPVHETPRYKPAYPPLAFWGVLLVVLTLVGVAFFDNGVTAPALLGGAGAAVLLLALALAASRRSLQVRGDGADPDASPATVWLAVSVAATALGAALGLWLVLIGGGMTLIGIGAVVRELRAQRRVARESEVAR